MQIFLNHLRIAEWKSLARYCFIAATYLRRAPHMSDSIYDVKMQVLQASVGMVGWVITEVNLQNFSRS